MNMNCDCSNLMDAVRYFADLRVCNEYMRGIKWPDGQICCFHCGSTAVYELSTRPILKCRDCKKQFSYKVGTIFEDSPLGLDKWFVAVWCIANAKNGISSHELGRALGVTQKTAWFMLHRVRESMRTEDFRKLAGEVESDETFIGGEARNMHAAIREKKIRGRGSVGKRIVHGLLERGGEVRAKVVETTEAKELQGEVRANVEKGSAVFTDAHLGYTGLYDAYVHEVVDHTIEYVRGRVHTNGLENFWSLFKRALKGTYTHCAPFHLQRYVDEEAFRFNDRKGDDSYRFDVLMHDVVGRRLTWRRLCGVDGCGFMELQ
jgi:transposase-like protein